MTTVLITGANRGLGLEFARQYANDGAKVIACCRKPADAKELQALAKSNGSVERHALDVSDFGAVRALAKDLTKDSIDILINNAGVYGPKRQSADDMDFDGWAHTLTVNTMGPLAVAQAFRANLLRGSEKKLVSITSGMGSTEENGGGYLAYRASKAALNNVMKSLSIDWRGDGIIAVVFDPGWVRTDMGGKNAPLLPEESVSGMRKVIAHLKLSDSGNFLNRNGEERPW
jgi:NAD(P)-dependent dehydrogenase (short-subunit alcohol dehydrogenase family)